MPGSFIFLINPFSKKDFDVCIAKTCRRYVYKQVIYMYIRLFMTRKIKKVSHRRENMKYCVLGFNYFVIVYIEYKSMCVSMKSAHVW